MPALLNTTFAVSPEALPRLLSWLNHIYIPRLQSASSSVPQLLELRHPAPDSTDTVSLALQTSFPSEALALQWLQGPANDLLAQITRILAPSLAHFSSILVPYTDTVCDNNVTPPANTQNP